MLLFVQKLRSEILDQLDTQLGDLIDDFVQEVEHIDQPSVSNGGTPTRQMYVFNITLVAIMAQLQPA